MRDFEYEAPTSLEDAVALLSENPVASRPLAGGTDLIDHIRTRRLEPDLVVDVKKIPELNVLEITDSGLRLGAAVPCYRIYGDSQIATSYAAVADSCRIIGGTQIQSRASVGGNLCNSGPAADSIPSLIALAARVVIAGPGGRREVAAEDFCTGPSRNVLESGELVVEIVFPARPQVGGSHYRRFIPRNEMDIAVVGCGVNLILEGGVCTAARVSLGAVAPMVLLVEDAGKALIGTKLETSAVEAAAAACSAACNPIDDKRGTIAYRTRVAGVLLKRAVGIAAERTFRA